MADLLEKELHRTCERVTLELSQINNKLDQNKNVMSPADIDLLYKILDIIKDTKSTLKKIYEIEDLERMGDGYSGNMMYINEPMWDRRYSGNNSYSGNSYRGTYTVESGNGNDGYSGRNMRRSYSRGSDARMELEDMLNNTRDLQEAEAIRKILNKMQ